MKVKKAKKRTEEISFRASHLLLAAFIITFTLFSLLDFSQEPANNPYDAPLVALGKTFSSLVFNVPAGNNLATGALVAVEEILEPEKANISLETSTAAAGEPSSFHTQEFKTQGEATSTSCGTLGSSLTLAANVTSTWTCFNITAANIVLDCVGYEVLYGTGDGNNSVGINITGYDNVTVKNCVVREGGSGTSRKSILLDDVFNITLFNNTITANNTDSLGVHLRNLAHNNNISFNYFNTTGLRGYAISLLSASGNNITNNTILTGLTLSGGNSHGAYLLTSSYNFIGFNLFKSIYTGDAIYLDTGTYNQIWSNTIISEGSSSGGISLRRSSDYNYFAYNNISTYGSAKGILFDIGGTKGAGGENNTFLNNNITTSKSPKIYYQTLLNSLPGANFLLYNNSFGMLNWSLSNLTTNLSLILGVSFFLENNTAGVINSDWALQLNGTATILLRNLTNASFTYFLSKEGVRCDNTPRCNVSFDRSAEILTATVSSFSNYSAFPPVNCSTLLGNTTLNQNVTSTGTCFHISTSNVILDCAGYEINYSWAGGFGYGINISNAENVTVKNCVIKEGHTTTNTKHGIVVSNSTNTTLFNISILTQGSGSIGLVLRGSNLGNISYLDINDTGTSSFGILVNKSANFTISASNITAWGTYAEGITLEQGSMNITVLSNYINAPGSTSIGVSLDSGSNQSLFYGNRILSTGFAGKGMEVIGNTSSNRITFNTIVANGLTAIGIYLADAVTQNNTLFNNTINSSDNRAILDGTGAYNNTLLYNNSFAELKWENSNITSYLNLSIGTSVYLEQNVAGLINSPGMSRLNETARITLRNISNSSPSYFLFKGGTRCDNTISCNATYNTTTEVLTADVSSFSNYSAQAPVNCSSLNVNTTMNQDLNFTGVCFTFSASNIALDCSGYTILGNGTGMGIFASSKSNLTVRNCLIQNFTYGIVLSAVSGATISHNILANHSLDGIYLNYTNRTLLENNTAFNNSRSGFFLEALSSGNLLVNNTAYFNRYRGFHLFNTTFNNLTSNTAFSNNGSGIVLAASNFSRLLSNTVYNNTGAGLESISSSGDFWINNTAYNNSDYGFYLTGSSNTSLSFNTAYNHTGSAGFGLYLTTSSTLTNNTAYFNTRGFYLFTNSSNNVLINNTARNHSQSGFELYDSARNNTLTSNAAYHNFLSGFYAHVNTSNNTFSENTAHGNWQHGFHLFGSSGDILNFNFAYNNSVQGIYLTNASNSTTVRSNTLYNNSGDGLAVDSQTKHVQAINNTLYGNSRGIIINYTSYNNLTNNTLRENKAAGLYLLDSSFSQVNLNYAYNNTDYGVRVMNSVNSTFEGNSAYNNSLYGYYLANSVNLTFTSNLAYNHSSAGFSLASFVNNSFFVNNTAYNNSKGFNLSSSYRNTLANNTVYLNAYGFELVSLSSNNFTSNRVYNNSLSAFYLSSANNNSFDNNTLYSNAKNGFDFIGSSYNNITLGSITESGDDSINVLQVSNSNTFLSVIISASADSSSDGTILVVDSLSNIFRNVTVQKAASIAVKLANANNTLIKSSTFNNASYGFHFNSSNTNTLDSNSLDNHAVGLYLSSASTNNTFLNNNFSAISYYVILDNNSAGSSNTLYYNDTFGEINWTKSNLTANVSLMLDATIFLDDNLLGFVGGPDAMNLNNTIKMKMKGLAHANRPFFYKDGVQCESTGLCNFTYDSSTGILDANISFFSNYTTQSTVNCTTINVNVTLNQNIRSIGTCFTIGSSNIILDCAGFEINYSSTGTFGYGINASGVSNVTIKNCIVKEGYDTPNSKPAILLKDARNLTVFNNTLLTIGQNSSGILIDNSSQAENISFNNITTSGTSGYGIQINRSSNLTVSFNTISTSGSSALGLSLEKSSLNLSLISNTITTSGSNAHGISVSGSSNQSTIYNNYITSNGSSARGIEVIGNSSSNTFSRNRVFSTGTDGIALYLGDSLTRNNILINNTANATNNLGIFTLIDAAIDAASNTLIYNNSFAEVRWGKSNLTSYANLSLEGVIVLQDNLVSLTTSSGMGEINGTASIEFKGLTYACAPYLRKDGVRCDDSVLCNVTYDTSTKVLRANVSSFSDYTTLGVDCGGGSTGGGSKASAPSAPAPAPAPVTAPAPAPSETPASSPSETSAPSVTVAPVSVQAPSGGAVSRETRRVETRPAVSEEEVKITLKNEGKETITFDRPTLKVSVETVLENEEKIKQILGEEKVLTIKLLEESKAQLMTGRVSSLLPSLLVEKFVSVSGLSLTKEHITGSLLKTELLNPEEIVLAPGEEVEKTFTIRWGLAAEPRPVKIVFTSLGKEVLEKEVTFGEEVVTGTAVDINSQEKTLDLYLTIPKDGEAKEYFLEMDILQTRESFLETDMLSETGINSKTEKSPAEFLTGLAVGDAYPGSRNLYSEFFGPYQIEGDAGAVFAQQLGYNAKLYYGKAVVNTRIYREGVLVAANEFDVDFGDKEEKAVPWTWRLALTSGVFFTLLMGILLLVLVYFKIVGVISTSPAAFKLPLPSPPSVLPKKTILPATPTLKEGRLRREMEFIASKMQGYFPQPRRESEEEQLYHKLEQMRKLLAENEPIPSKKPVVAAVSPTKPLTPTLPSILSPPREKQKLDEELAQINQVLSQIDSLPQEKVLLKTTLPEPTLPNAALPRTSLFKSLFGRIAGRKVQSGNLPLVKSRPPLSVSGTEEMVEWNRRRADIERELQGKKPSRKMLSQR